MLMLLLPGLGGLFVLVSCAFGTGKLQTSHVDPWSCGTKTLQAGRLGGVLLGYVWGAVAETWKESGEDTSFGV